jgi:hypothetical protein
VRFRRGLPFEDSGKLNPSSRSIAGLPTPGLPTARGLRAWRWEALPTAPLAP